MTKRGVQHFKIWDGQSGDYPSPLMTSGGQPSKRTAEDIRRIGGEVIPGTSEEADEAALDLSWRYLPTANA